MVPGKEVEIGGEKYTLPPLPVNGVVEYLDLMSDRAKFAAMTGQEASKAWIGFIVRALKRNYPEVTVEQIGEHLDLNQVKEILAELRVLSGLEIRAAGEMTPVT